GAGGGRRPSGSWGQEGRTETVSLPGGGGRGRPETAALAVICRAASTLVALQQRQLLARPRRRLEQVGAQPPPLDIEAEPPGRDLEAAADLPRIGSSALHALAPFGVVVLAAAHRADQRHDVAVAVGIVPQEPVLEDGRHL